MNSLKKSSWYISSTLRKLVLFHFMSCVVCDFAVMSLGFTDMFLKAAVFMPFCCY